jgi:spoIIIJ-associated protein
MEWVETTGRTVEEAKEAALDELGVDETEAEFEILAEPRPGLFGRLRAEARVRARVRPTAPRAKEDRRDRRRRSGAAGNRSASGRSHNAGPASNGSATDSAEVDQAQPGGDAAPPGRKRSRRHRGTTGSKPAPGLARSSGTDTDVEEEGAGVEVDLEKQAQVAEEFLRQLIVEFGVSGTVTRSRPDEETVELQLSGSDLGILIGPKGATLLAIQNLVRNVVHHQTGANNGHINVDVGGYRQKRTEALIRFAKQVAANVKESGVRTAMEPMSAVDRKVVHDAIGEIEGVSTISEGEEPRRRVVVLPSAPS